MHISGESQSSQPTQDSMTDDLPPLQNTLGSQPEAHGSQVPQQSLAEMMQDVADMDKAANPPAAEVAAVPAAETADAGFALVIQTEPASQGEHMYTCCILMQVWTLLTACSQHTKHVG